MFFISSLEGGGAERVMSILCNELVDRGHEVYLATNKQIPFAYELDNRITILELYPNNFSQLNKMIRWLKFYTRIRSLVREVKPDVITTFMYGLNLHIILATLGLNTPIIASEHTPFNKSVNWFHYIGRFYINNLATYTILLTEYDYKFLGNRLKNKIIIPNPLSFPIIEEIKERRKNVLAAGSIDRWSGKGFDTLIKIWGKVSPKHPGWVLEIAGNGTEESFNHLKSVVKEMNVENTVIFLGFQEEIDKLLQFSSIFVLSSKYEGFGMVLTEAMSQGCACISYNCIAGPNEIITHNKSGLLVEDQNMEEMEIILGQLIADDDLRLRLSEGGLKEVERFTPKMIIDKWERLFNTFPVNSSK